MMNRQAVQSRDIAVVGYDEKVSVLEVVFRRGGVYHYFDVPHEVHKNLLNASSLGTFFSENIKERYSYKKVH